MLEIKFLKEQVTYGLFVSKLFAEEFYRTECYERERESFSTKGVAFAIHRFPN